MQLGTAGFADLVGHYGADFTGRRWLVEQVEARLEDPGCRFVVLTGQPGVGKTAFLAHLAATNPAWPRYFIRRDSHQLLLPGDATTFLLSVGGQLAASRPELFPLGNVDIAARQRIGTVDAGGEAVAVRIRELWASPFHTTTVRADQEVLRAAGRAVSVEIDRMMGDARLRSMQDLQQLALVEPCRVLARIDPRARVVVLVDALDELRYSPAERDVLQALSEFPDTPPNLRFIVSSRPDTALNRLLARADACAAPLEMASTANKRDLHAYARRALADTSLLAVLARRRLPAERFLEGILAKAAGNFLYLKSVLAAIQDHLADPGKAERLHGLLDVEELPGELGDLYGYFLASVSSSVEGHGFGAGAWRRYLAPLLGVLAVAQAPLSDSQLVAFTDLEAEDVRGLLGELRQFVPGDAGGRALYRVYHSSFAEYLLDSQRNRDYWIDARKAHGRIAEHYLSSWGSSEGDIDVEADAGVDGGGDGELDYGLRHLAVHLDQAGRHADLYRLLLDSPAWMKAKFQRLNGDAAYDADLGLATARFTPPLTASQLLTLVRLHATRRVVRQRVDLLGDDDLRLLVLLSREDEALGQTRLRAAAKDVVGGLLVIGGALREQHRPDVAVLDEAMGKAQAIHDARERVQALTAVAEALAEQGRADDADTLLDQAEQAAVTIDYDYWRWTAQSEIATIRARIGQPSRAAGVAQAIGDRKVRTDALRAVAEALEAAGRTVEAREAFTELAHALRHTSGGDQPAEVQSGVFDALLRAGRFEEARATALGMTGDHNGGQDWSPSAADAEKAHAAALRKLGVALATAGRAANADATFTEAHRAAQRIRDAYDRACALSDLTVALAGTGRHSHARQVLNEAGATARGVTTWRATEPRYAHGFALGAWIRALLATGEIDAAKDVVLERGEVDTQAQNLREVALALAGAGRVWEARELANLSTEHYGYRENTLHRLATLLARSGKFSAARKLVDANLYERSKRDSQRDLAIELARTGQFERALEIGEPSWQPEDRAPVLRAVIDGMARSGRTADANRVFAELDATLQRSRNREAAASALRELALALHAAGMVGQAGNAFAQAEAATGDIEDFFRRIDQLRDLAAAYATSGRLEAVRRVERTIKQKRPDERPPLDNTDEKGLTWEYDHRAEALRAIVAALAKAGHYAEAEAAASRIEDQFYCRSCKLMRVLAYQDLAVTLLAHNHPAQAHRVFNTVADDLRELASHTLDAGVRRQLTLTWPRALDAHAKAHGKSSTSSAPPRAAAAHPGDDGVDDTLPEPAATREGPRAAAALASAGRLDEALDALGPCELDAFLEHLARWADAFEHVRPGLSIEAVEAAMRIIGWVRPDWRHTADLLFARQTTTTATTASPVLPGT